MNCEFTIYVIVTRQMKTIQYALSSPKCMDEGWTIKPATPPPEEPPPEEEKFQIQVNSTLLQVRCFFF